MVQTWFVALHCVILHYKNFLNNGQTLCYFIFSIRLFQVILYFCVY